jgi:hypothetical protein
MIIRSYLLQDNLSALNKISQLQAIALRDRILLDDPKYRDMRCLARFMGKFYSQCDEDAINTEIFRRLGDVHKTFVEIGAGDGSENVTRMLLEIGWTGIWIEADGASILKARKTFSKAIAEDRLKIVHSMATRENVAILLKDSGVPTEFGLLAIDIDMNTSHIWRALYEFMPRVVCIEYNASIPASVPFEVQYEPLAVWNKSNYFGAGLKSLELYGREAGYALIGCDFMGVNAFFIREPDADQRFLSPFTAEMHYEPARYVLAYIDRAHPSTKSL